MGKLENLKIWINNNLQKFVNVYFLKLHIYKIIPTNLTTQYPYFSRFFQFIYLFILCFQKVHFFIFEQKQISGVIMDEKDTFNELKQTLQRIKKQKKRRKILSSYEKTFISEEYISRYEKLVDKAKQRPYIPKVIGIWGLILYIPAWLVTIFAGFPILQMEENNLQFALLLLVCIPSLWCLIGPLVIMVSGIMTLMARKNAKYYLNITEI